MTETVVNEADIRQYWSTQERVTHWVQEHDGMAFNSPNVSPSVLEGDEGALSCAVSDVESSHSLPPKLMLRYPDGTEIPIPHPSSPQGSQNNNPLHSSTSGHANAQPSNRSRSGSAPSRHPSKNPSSPHSAEREREKLRSHSPEKIRIFPSDSNPEAIINEVSRSHQSHHSTHTRSRSLPRNAFSPEESQVHDPMPYSNLPPHSRPGGAVYATPPQQTPIKIPRTPPPDHGHGKPNLARSQPAPWHPYTNGSRMMPVTMNNPHRHVHNPKHVPPSIVYAPSSNSRGNYNPPAIYSYPPNFGPNGVMYSHSVPPTKMYQNPSGTPYPSAGAPSAAGYHPPPVPPPPPPVPTSSHSRSRHRSRDRSREQSEERRHRPHEEPEQDRHRSRSRSHSHSQSQDVSRGTSGSSKSKKSSRSRTGHDRTRSLPLQEIVRTVVETPPRSPSPTYSDATGSTYYVMPNGRQKIHILHPNQNHGSIRTATSSTKSPTTPLSPSGSLKKPFFARLRGLAGRLSSSGSSNKSDQRRLRRHSTGNSNSSQGRPEASSPHAR